MIPQLLKIIWTIDIYMIKIKIYLDIYLPVIDRMFYSCCAVRGVKLLAGRNG